MNDNSPSMTYEMIGFHKTYAIPNISRMGRFPDFPRVNIEERKN